MPTSLKARWLGGLIAFLGIPLGAQVFDLSADFSLAKNPNAVWEYGFSTKDSLVAGQFQLDQKSVMIGPIGFWHPTQGDAPGLGYYPYIAYNTTRETQEGSKGWALSDGQIAMEGSNTGQYSLVRFVSPRSGPYSVAAKFVGIHYGLSTTDVHVLKNGISVFDSEIDGYGGDPAFHAVQGSNPRAEYTARMHLNAGERVTFAVGYGKNKTNYGDTTGLSVKIVLLDKDGTGKR
jgi:hypothetical protein